MFPQVKIRRASPCVVMPEYKTAEAAGLDVCAFIDEDTVLEPGEIRLINTGIYLEIPVGYEVQVRSRSGLALKGIVVANAPGTIDSDYRGECKVMLQNRGQRGFILRNGERIAQFVVAPVAKATLVETETLSDTARGEGGFGSTGMK
jgi:dUTP pyrophosphatase